MSGGVSSRAVRGAMINTVAGYGMGFLGFIFNNLLLLQFLTPEDVGLFGAGLAIMLAFARVKLWGLNALIIAETDPDDLQISTQFWLSVGLSLIVPVLLLLGWPALRLIFTESEILLALFLASFAIFENEGLASTPESMLVKELRYDVVSSLHFVTEFIKITVTVAIAAFFSATGWALAIGFALKALLYCVGVWWFAPRRPRFMFSVERARELMRQGGKLLWGGIGTFLAYQYDDIIVRVVSGQGPLGNYNRAYNWSLMPMTIIGGILGVVAPTYAQVKASRAALSEAVSAVFDVVALIAVPASFGLAVIAPEFVAAFFPDAWLPAVPMLQILILYSLFRPMNDSIGALAPTLGLNHVHRSYGIIQSITMLVLATSLTLLFDRLGGSIYAGANGAALAAGLTVVVGFLVLHQGLLRDHIDVDYARIFGPPLVGSALATGITLGAVLMWRPDAALLTMLYKMAVFSAVYAAVLLVSARDRVLLRARQVMKAVRRQPAS